MLLGDSVAMQIRPYRESKIEASYITHIERRYIGAEIINLATPGATLTELLTQLFFNGRRSDPDVIILNIGINDCVPRIWPKKLWSIFHYGVQFRAGWLPRGLLLVAKGIDRYIQPYLLCLKIGKSWTSISEFERLFQLLLVLIEKEFSCKVIILNIPKTNDQVERLLPGTQKAILKVNTIFAKLSNGKRSTYLLDVNKMASSNPDKFIPEGIHYSAKLHAIIATEILNLIKS